MGSGGLVHSTDDMEPIISEEDLCLRSFKFLSYLKEEFPGCLNTHWNWDLLTNCIAYVFKTSRSGKEAKDKLTQIIPEINQEEVNKFFPD